MHFAWGSAFPWGLALGLTTWGGGIIGLMMLVKPPAVVHQPPPEAPGLSSVEEKFPPIEPKPEWIFAVSSETESLPPPGWAKNEYFKPLSDEDTVIQPRVDETQTVEADVMKKPNVAPQFFCNKKTFWLKGHLHWYCKR